LENRDKFKKLFYIEETESEDEDEEEDEEDDDYNDEEAANSEKINNEKIANEVGDKGREYLENYYKTTDLLE
jgi:hypothetical protein